MMARIIAQLRVETIFDIENLCIELLEDNRVVFSQVLAPGMTRENAERLAMAINFPEAVMVMSAGVGSGGDPAPLQRMDD